MSIGNGLLNLSTQAPDQTHHRTSPGHKCQMMGPPLKKKIVREVSMKHICSE